MADRKPFIPLEREIDQLIGACSMNLGCFLLLLKETGMCPGEAWGLKWKDVDVERRLVSVNAPEKGSNARILDINLSEEFQGYIEPLTMCLVEPLPLYFNIGQ